MYKVDSLKKIAEVLKLDVDKFIADFKSENEVALEVPALYTEEQNKLFGDNRFNEGKKAASEILVKDLKQKHGIEFDGKTVEGFLDKFSEKVIADAKIAPDEKNKKLLEDNKALQLKIQEAENKVQAKEKEFTERLFGIETKSQILSFIPEKTIIPRDDLAVLFMNSYRVAKEDDRVIVYKGSEAMKDNVLNPVPLKDVVSQFSEKYIDKNGMGGGDAGGGTGGKFTKMSQYMDHCKNNNIDPMGAAGQDLLLKNKEANFDYNS